MGTFSISTPSRLTNAMIDQYLVNVKAAWEHSGDTVEVDWHDLEQIEGAAGSLLANGLIGSLSNVPLVIRLPAKSRFPTLQRTGISFALANRDATTDLEGDTADFDLSSWRTAWAPAASVGRAHQESLFPPEAINESSVIPNVAARTHVAFVNAHLAGSGVAESDLREKLRPWLRRLLRAKDRTLSDSGRTFIESVGVIVDELVGNVREHASRNSSGRPSDSLVSVGVTERLLHLTVMDTGPGIVTTARPKLPAGLGDDEILKALLEGSYRGWGRGRGLGLPRIWVEADRFGGQILIATGRSRVGVHRSKLRVTPADFDLTGTVVSASLRRP